MLKLWSLHHTCDFFFLLVVISDSSSVGFSRGRFLLGVVILGLGALFLQLPLLPVLAVLTAEGEGGLLLLFESRRTVNGDSLLLDVVPSTGLEDLLRPDLRVL